MEFFLILCNCLSDQNNTLLSFVPRLFVNYLPIVKATARERVRLRRAQGGSHDDSMSMSQSKEQLVALSA
jgi:hypothetical protein